ncbi:MAG: ABC transporter permease subunit [Armatimonadetes bacterium]|nr:ABC transporter permease subunit [Armatimonadota bacterium]
MNWWQDLIVANPMLIETKRFMRRFLGAHAMTNWIAVLIIGILLSMVVGLIYIYEFNYIGASMAALLTFSILVPIMLHGAVAGERERRSWDMLLVAPVTSSQIVAGKFMGAATAIGFTALAFGAAILISYFPGGDKLPTGTMILLVIASFAYCLAAFTLLVSTRSRRSMTALGIVYGCLFLGLIVLPALLATTGADNSESAFYLNPYYAITQINLERYDNFTPPSFPEGAPVLGRNSYVVYGFAHVGVYLGLAALCLYLATIALNSAGWEDPMLKRRK